MPTPYRLTMIENPAPAAARSWLMNPGSATFAIPAKRTAPDEHGSVEDAVARPGEGREDQRRREAAGDRDADEGDGAHEVGGDRARPSRQAVGGAPEQRTERHERNEVGDQDRRDRPRAVEA